MNWKALFQGLIGAAIGGAATTVTGYLTDPIHADFTHLGPAAAAGAIIGVAGLFKASPMAPPVNPPEPPPSNTAQFPTTK